MSVLPPSTRPARGSLVCIGLGMTLGAHVTPRAQVRIEEADIVFVAVSDPIVELWVQSMHHDVRSLQGHYAVGKPRDESYLEMVAVMLAAVAAGHRVCGAFYGHPGVFARVPHDAIAAVRVAGFDASMEPGVSAADCLYADLAIDPGDVGCQHYEASQFMLYRRIIDPSAYLVLWQVGMAGDIAARRRVSTSAHHALLRDLLAQDYPLAHQVVAYEAATLAINQPRRERIALADLADAALHPQTTLVVPPCRALCENPEMVGRLAALERARS